MRHYVNYGTGAGNEWVNGTIEEAKMVAEQGLSYTQEDVRIQSEDGECISVLKWYGTAPEEGDVITARFGDHGFYGEWWDM